MSLLGNIDSVFAELGVNKGSFIIENNITLVAPMIKDLWTSLVDELLKNSLVIKKSPIRENLILSPPLETKCRSEYLGQW